MAGKSVADKDRRLIARAALSALAVSAALPGIWATVAQRSFYDSFPGIGSWVAPLGQFNAHLTADVGAFYLAFAVLFAWAAVRLSADLVLPVCVVWIGFSTLHLIWHLQNLGPLESSDAIGETLSLSLVVALAVIPIWAVQGNRSQKDEG